VIAHSEPVGAAAAVRPSSTGTPPGGGTRTLDIGTSILADERIRTSASGSLQVMFLDKTTLTIGPNSDLVIDTFVYKAGAAADGRFSAVLAKGALRFVGGQISHTAGATISTPSATIGIRGGAAFITYDKDCRANEAKAGADRKDCTKVVCVAGACSVKSLIDSRNLQLKISQAVEISALGMTQPFNASSVTLNSVVLGGSGGIKGGPGTTDSKSNLSGQSALDKILTEQAPPPPPPAAPP
jgi:hypothetical protein